MIYQALSILKEELSNHLTSKDAVAIDYVILDNVSLIGANQTGLENKIIISLINTENEKTLRNKEFKTRSPLTGNMIYRNPKVSLNLYVLFSSNFDRYENSLNWLSCVIEFFQSKNVFDSLSSSGSSNFQKLPKEHRMNFKMILDLHSLSIEQLNNLWGTIGGRQVPSVLYKARLIELYDNQIQQTGPPITEIESTEVIN